ncbi:MAG: hypothetical protein ACJASQ_002500 [Crocinitomicaceae bacterium]|jgi:hypothetical protein
MGLEKKGRPFHDGCLLFFLLFTGFEKQYKHVLYETLQKAKLHHYKLKINKGI